MEQKLVAVARISSRSIKKKKHRFEKVPDGERKMRLGKFKTKIQAIETEIIMTIRIT